MRLTKLAAVAAALVVTAGTTAVLETAPASAATATKAKLDISGKKSARGAYGDYVGLFGGSVKDGSGNDVGSGVADLQRKLPGKAWKTIGSDTSPGFLYFGPVGSTAKGNAKYRVHFRGDTTYAASYSNVVTVTTRWKVKDTSACPHNHNCHISGKLSPKAKHKKLVVQVKHGKWKKYRVLHTNAKSKYKVGVTGSRGNGTKYRLLVPGNKSISGVKIRYTVTRS